MKWLRRFFARLGLTNCRGETDAGAGGEGGEDGQGEAAPGGEGESGQPAKPPVKVAGGPGEGGEGGQGGPADDDPFGGDYTKALEAYKELQKTSKPKEMTLAGLTKHLSSMGVKVVDDGQGTVKLVLSEDTSKREQAAQRRFTEEHAGQIYKFFDKPESGKTFLDTLKLFVQDAFDDGITEKEKFWNSQREFVIEEKKTEAFIKQVYPDADPDVEGFPKEGTPLFNLSSKIYDANPEYQKHPKGQLWAVVEAATQLGVSPAAIENAREAGRKEGKENKKILTRVGGGAGAGKGAAGEVSDAAFVNMTPTQRKEWQQAQFAKRKITTGG